MQDFIGINITKSDIKISQISTIQGTKILRVLDTQPIQTNIYLSELVQDQKTLSETLRILVKQNNINTSNVVATFPEIATTARLETDFPYLKSAELNEAVIYEASKYISMPIDEMQLDKIVLAERQKDYEKRLDIYWIAAPKPAVLRFSNIFMNAGLNLLSLETESISLARSSSEFMNYNKIEQKVCVIMQISNTESLITITFGDKVLYSQVMANGIDTLITQISTFFKIDSKMSLNYIKTYGLDPTFANGALAKMLEPVLQVFTDQIKRASSFLSSRVVEYTPKQLLLCGIGTQINQIDKLFANTTGLPTMIFDPLTSLSIDKSISNKLISLYTPAFCAVIGLGLKKI